MRSHSRRSRIIVGIAGLAVLAFGSPAGAVASVNVVRNDGVNRYQVSRATATYGFATAKNVILARGDLYPDALGASYLAGNLAAPILLTTGDTLHADTKQALKDLKAENVRLVGGTAAISEGVKSELQALGYSVTRTAGTDRYQTAADIASAPGTDYVGSVASKLTAIIASGTNFPDALAGGPVAYLKKLPILLTAPNTLTPITKTTLDTLKITNVILLGGTTAISPVVEDQLTGSGRTVTRIADIDRYGTAAKLADYEVKTLGFPSFVNVILATGTDFPDAEIAGPLGGVKSAPILLVGDVIPGTTEAVCRAYKATIATIIVEGNTSSVSTEAVNACKAAAQS